MAIIIGSGAGSGLLAMKLVKAGIPTTILEQGSYLEPKEAFNTYSKDNVLVSKKNISKEIEDKLKEKVLKFQKNLVELM